MTRTDGARGAVTVDYQTVSAGATPGLDYVATSGTLSFAAGATSATIQVPVLPDPWDNHDEYVQCGAQFARRAARPSGRWERRCLRIIDVDPNNTPPEVSEPDLDRHVTLDHQPDRSVSPRRSIRAYAMNPADYQLVAPGLGNRVVPLDRRNPTTARISRSPWFRRSRFRRASITTSRSSARARSAIRDIAGNLLDGAGNGQAGSNYQASFAQGTQLKYVDAIRQQGLTQAGRLRVHGAGARRGRRRRAARSGRHQAAQARRSRAP